MKTYRYWLGFQFQRRRLPIKPGSDDGFSGISIRQVRGRMDAPALLLQPEVVQDALDQRAFVEEGRDSHLVLTARMPVVQSPVYIFVPLEGLVNWTQSRKWDHIIPMPVHWGSER